MRSVDARRGARCRAVISRSNFAPAGRNACTRPACPGSTSSVRRSTVSRSSWMAALPSLTSLGQVVYRHAVPTARDYLSTWLHHLVLCVMKPQGVPRSTCWIGRGARFVFREDVDAHRHLCELATLYRAGLCAPLPFFPKTSWAWVDKGASAAFTAWEGGFERAGEQGRSLCEHRMARHRAALRRALRRPRARRARTAARTPGRGGCGIGDAGGRCERHQRTRCLRLPAWMPPSDRSACRPRDAGGRMNAIHELDVFVLSARRHQPDRGVGGHGQDLEYRGALRAPAARDLARSRADSRRHLHGCGDGRAP